MQDALRRKILMFGDRNDAPNIEKPCESDQTGQQPLSSVVLRFGTSERMLHWTIAIPFVVCLLTAVVLVAVYNLAPLLGFRDLFSWVHRIAGVLLIILPPYVVIRHWRDYKAYFRNIKEAWVWRKSDVKWLFLMGPATFSKNVSLPEQGKFNAGQKLNFMMVTITYPLLIITGLMIWPPGIPLWPWLVHFALAVFATPFVLGHIYMAAVNPSTRKSFTGMVTGFVDRQYAKHHHGRWYRENFEGDQKIEEHPAEAVDPSRLRAVMRCSSCNESLSTSWSWLLRKISEVDRIFCPNCGMGMSLISAINDPKLLRWLLAQLQGKSDRDTLVISRRASPVTEHHESKRLIK